MTADLEASVAHWRAAENRLYPIVMVRPDLYERSVRIVRAVADDLRSAQDTESLLEAYGRAADLVAAVVQRLELPAEEIDMGLVTGAAFSLRYRELLEELGRSAAIRRIQEGRERGAQWVTVYETGQGMPPYRRLEMQLASGVGIHAFIEMDPETGGPLFGLETIQLDPQTGDWVHDTEPLSARETFAERARWEEAIQAVRRRYE